MEELYSITSAYTDQSISAIHHSLRASRRRLVVILVVHYTLPQGTIHELHSLQPDIDSSGVNGISVRQLATDIVAIEEDILREHATGPAYRSAYNSLVQSHLPRLDEVAAIRFDQDRKIVRPDKNLFALASVAAVTSPLAQKLFHASVADLYAGGAVSSEDSIGD